MQKGDSQLIIPWKVINAFYMPAEERKLSKGEREDFIKERFWDTLNLSDLENTIANTPYDFIFSYYIDQVKNEQQEEEYKLFLTYFQTLKKQSGTTQNIFNLVEHLDLYAGFLQEKEKNDRLATICDEGIKNTNELINIYQANNFYEAISTTLEQKAKFYCVKGQSQADIKSITKGLEVMEQIKKINSEQLTAHQYNIQGELFAYLATMHQNQGNIQAEYVAESMSCLEKALLEIIDEDFLINYSNMYTLIEDDYTLPLDKKRGFKKRAQEFMKHLRHEHKDNKIVDYYAEDFFDEDEGGLSF